jgi:hypothetical protein
MSDTGPLPHEDDPLIVAGRAYFAERRARVDGFAKDLFGLRGTFRLHRKALVLDLLRAPVNVLMGLVAVIQRVAVLLLGVLRLQRAALWLRARPVLFTTDVATEVERRVLTDLLELPVPAGARRSDWPAAVLAAPELRGLIRRAGSVAAAEGMAQEALHIVNEYAGTRTAVADMATALGTLAFGAVILHAVTPGMISMAPSIASTLAFETAVAEFPLGSWLGGTWYWLFPTEATLWLYARTLGALVMLAAVISAFGGLVADPVQLWTGVHRWRLLRMIDALEAEFMGSAVGFAALEHYLARVMDLADAGVSVVRHLKG